MTLMPGAEPFYSDGGPVGALLCHGFTGTPQSLRPWADELAAAGLTVRLPRLPGHGTRWEDLALTGWPDWYAAVERAFLDLRETCQTVVVMGLSMGGTLSLRLAEVHGRDVAGLVLVNPSLFSERKALRLLPLARHVTRSLPPIASDIAKPGQHELAYERMPSSALYSLTRLWKLTKSDLGKVTQPVLLFHSAVDHVVEPSNSRLLLSRISSTEVETRLCADSYHVATLDYDADTIFAGSLDFVRRLTTPLVEGSTG